MSVFRRIGFSLAASVVTACASDSIINASGPFDHAAVTFACGPADGPALAIYLAPNPITSPPSSGVFVRISLEGTIDEVSGRLFSISDQAGAWLHSDGNNQEAATGGYLLIGATHADKSIDGSFALSFPNAGHLEGPFHAEWIASNVVCA